MLQLNTTDLFIFSTVGLKYHYNEFRSQQQKTVLHSQDNCIINEFSFLSVLGITGSTLQTNFA